MDEGRVESEILKTVLFFWEKGDNEMFIVKNQQVKFSISVKEERSTSKMFFLGGVQRSIPPPPPSLLSPPLT